MNVVDIRKLVINKSRHYKVPYFEIRLTKDEWNRYLSVAQYRYGEKIYGDWLASYGCQEEGYEIHAIGAGAEMAVAKLLNRYHTKGEPGDPDIMYKGHRIEVRCRREHDWDLMGHPEDPDDAIMVLVTGMGPTFRVWGWAWGHEVKRKEFWPGPNPSRPAFVLPKGLLHPWRDIYEL